MPSQVINISRICVLIWLTIFFETVRTTTPSTFTDADTSPYATATIRTTTASTFTDADTSQYATETVTTPSTFTDADTSPYATDNTTENVTDITATTIPNNKTENVTEVTATTLWNNTTENVTDFTATTLSNNTTENVTEVTATTLWNITTENVTDFTAKTIWRNTTGLVTSIPTTGTPVDPSTPSNDNNRDKDIIILYILFGVCLALIGVIMVIVLYFLYLKCCKSEKNPWAIERLPSPKFQTTGRISRMELWKMMEYATGSEDKNKLGEVIRGLTKDGTYGATGKTLRRATSKEESDYLKLVSWKETYKGAALMEIYRKLFEAGMRETMKKLQVFRGNVSNTVPPTDLEHVLWQIGGKSPDNIIKLLKKLNVNPQMQPDASLKEMVNEAGDRMQTWQAGYVPINPVVMLSLALEEFQISPLEEEFFQVPENQKKPLEEAEKKKYVCDATIRHCKRILEVIRSKGGDDVIVISKTLEENNKALFNAYRMVEEWLEAQETSNYKKRRALEDAIKCVEISEQDPGNDVLIATAIRDEASKVEAAWNLLMTDIRPFAKALGVDERKLNDYKPPFQGSHLEMGTVGLVSKLVDY